jgi:hypothetical protein
MRNGGDMRKVLTGVVALFVLVAGCGALEPTPTPTPTPRPTLPAATANTPTPARVQATPVFATATPRGFMSPGQNGGVTFISV